MERREMLKRTSALVLGLSAFPQSWVAAAPGKKHKILFFTRSEGFEHSPVHRTGNALAHAETVLTKMGRRAGFEVDCSKDGRVFDGSLDSYDAIAFYTCGDLTRPSLDKAPAMTARGKRKLLDAIAAGKGFVGFHSTSGTFLSQGKANENQSELDPFIAMLGGEFVAHGPQQERSLFFVSRFPGVGELGIAEGLSFTDEWYALKNFARDLHVIAILETEGMQGDCYHRPPFPLIWAHRHGQGRVFYNSLGHREDIWTNPFFQSITLGGLAWALGNVKAEIRPNIDKVTPHARQLIHQKS
jgi:type 1 glutamine amidotransferase